MHAALTRSRPQTGFLLAEAAFAVVITGIIVMTLLPALAAVRSSTERTTTTTVLQTLVRATAAYVQAHGCLPCPTPATQTGTGFGRVRGDNNAAACGVCAVPEGIVPFASLGLPPSQARDGWERWITMRIEPHLAEPALVPPTASCSAADIGKIAGCVTETPGQNGFCLDHVSIGGTPVQVTTPEGTAQRAAVIFVSHGKNGHGAYRYVEPSNNRHNGTRSLGDITPCAKGGSEACNADGDNNFVDAQQVTGTNNSYDDMMTYLDRNALVSYLGTGACQSSW